jgi:hypothetical protein
LTIHRPVTEEVTNNHPVTGDGTGNPHTISLDVNHSTISGSRYYNLWVNDVTPLTNLRVMVQDSDLSLSLSGVAVAFDMQPSTGGTTSSQIDLGGGALGSAGGNCIFGGSIYNLGSDRLQRLRRARLVGNGERTAVGNGH